MLTEPLQLDADDAHCLDMHPAVQCWTCQRHGIGNSFHLLDSHQLAVVIVHAHVNPSKSACSNEIAALPVHDPIWKAWLGLKYRLCSSHICPATSRLCIQDMTIYINQACRRTQRRRKHQEKGGGGAPQQAGMFVAQTSGWTPWKAGRLLWYGVPHALWMVTDCHRCSPPTHSDCAVPQCTLCHCFCGGSVSRGALPCHVRSPKGPQHAEYDLPFPKPKSNTHAVSCNLQAQEMKACSNPTRP